MIPSHAWLNQDNGSFSAIIPQAVYIIWFWKALILNLFFPKSLYTNAREVSMAYENSFFVKKGIKSMSKSGKMTMKGLLYLEVRRKSGSNQKCCNARFRVH